VISTTLRPAQQCSRAGTAASVIQSLPVRFCIGNNPAGFASVVTYQNAILRAHDATTRDRTEPLF
jgi:hypothetical protein